MYESGTILGVQAVNQGTDIVVHVNNQQMAAVIKRKCIKSVHMQFDDGRLISIQQRKKIYATLKDISLYTGYLPEECKELMKYYHIQKAGCEYFSLADCPMNIARDFINTLTDFCLENGIITSESLLDRTDDISTYLYQCLKHRKCCICGRNGEIHHWDAIGMGNDRRIYDDSKNRKVCLCRMHHVIAHQKGVVEFARDYHVYGITFGGDNDGIQVSTL